MIIFLDNKDSFSFTIVQSIQKETEQEVKVIRSEEITLPELIEMQPSSLIVGPGPGTPSEAGISIEAIKYFAGKIPILGICLGHQAIGTAFGAQIVNAKNIKHGFTEEMQTDGNGLFRLTGKTITCTRYNSLVINEETLSSDFIVTAKSADGDIMGIRHKTMTIEGVQFHPESIASKQGQQLFTSFINYRRENIPIAKILDTLIAKKDLDEETAGLFMENLTDGTLDERITSAILTAMAAKGPSVSEMTGCAKVLMEKKKNIPISRSGLAEIVGTGGDGKYSFNISSLSALCASSCGQPMAKHGNRAVSSKSGAADFYEALGININTTPEKTAEIIQKTGFGFLMAPIYHSAMRFAAPVRKVLGIKTIMNVLGPLLNPAGAEYEVLGVYNPDLLEPVARASKKLGAKRVMTIYSKDGYDEISPLAATYVYQINEDNTVLQYMINPEELGITDCNEEELKGGNGKENAELAMQILHGKGRKTIRAAVALNTAAILYLSGKAPSIKEGYAMALEAIDSGRVLKKLEQVKEISNAA